MRLTLRTLLAYLDDTLDASEIKEIGEKVAESDAAQELVARLRQVTRRRRLTTPSATGPEATDPNDVAEYLDNELDSEQVALLEKLALESDVHLAEIAACHQILTLVLGEPALVPPKARERMYALVRGREAIPYRKATTPPRTSTQKENVEHEDELALASGWLRWVLPVAGVLLVGLLGFAVYQALPGQRGKDNRIASSGDRNSTKPDPEPDKDPVKPPEKDPVKPPEKDPVKPPEKDPVKPPEKDPVKPPEKDPVKPPEGDPVPVKRADPPAKEVVAVANFVGGLSDQPTVLISRTPEGTEWRRYSPGNTVSSNTPIMTLPGFTGIVQTRSGVAVLLRGHVREFTVAPIMDYLMESVVVLHPSQEFDLDMTLQRGRIYLSNRKEKGPAKLRLRFESEVWDITLANPGDEIGVDLFRSYSPLINHRKGEEPRADCYLAVLRGETDLRIDGFNTYNIEVEAPKWARMEWDSFTRSRGPFKEDRATPALAKVPMTAAILEQLPRERRDFVKRMQTALKNLETLFGTKKTVETALKEMREQPDPLARMLAVYCMTAVDMIGPVIDALGDEDDTHAADREAAMFALQRWVSRGPDQATRLFDEKTGSGILIEKKYKKGDANRFVQLLHPFLAEDLVKDETYLFLANCLKSSRIAIAELGFWNLYWMCRGKLPGTFNAAMPLAAREKYADQIEQLIEKKQLPPPPDKPMPGTGGATK
ncbi:MAG: hypothetical protein U0840_18660 [Gemmataceae bacterium]